MRTKLLPDTTSWLPIEQRSRRRREVLAESRNIEAGNIESSIVDADQIGNARRDAIRREHTRR